MSYFMPYFDNLMKNLGVTNDNFYLKIWLSPESPER